MKVLRMGVMNVTPNSFSDGGEFFTPDSIQHRINFLKQFEAIDIGAESTAPTNASISWREEWERWKLVLPYLKNISTTISADTYHPETIFELVKFWRDNNLQNKLIWNDVSGKFDDSVREFLKTGFDYVFCHNLAPSRELSGRHMDYVSDVLDLESYFSPYKYPQVIFDPCLGFSKSYEQNWGILSCFGKLQHQIGHHRWLLGFSRKSFLKKKYSTQNLNELDNIHVKEVNAMIPKMMGETFIRTHRPELL